MNSEPEHQPEQEYTEDEAPASGGIGPHRLHPAAMIITALKSARQFASAALIPGLAALFSGGFGVLTVLLVILGVVVLLAGAAVWGFLSWRATTYRVAGGAFYLRRGVLQKSERTIPLEHVQSLDTVQGVVQRLFGVVELRVETAGGGVEGSDASLAALDRGSADELRNAMEGGSAEPVEEEGGPEVLRRLSGRDLLIAGATSGQIGVALSVVAVASQLFDNFFTEGFARRVFESLAPGGVAAALVIVLAFGLFAWLLAIAGTVLAYAGFTLSRDGEFLYIRRGLLERREATIPLARIQAVQIVEGVLRQPFGLAMLKVESAGYGESSGVSTTLFPLLPRRRVPEFLRAAVPEFSGSLSGEALQRPPRRAIRRYVFRSVAPVAALLVAAGTVLIFSDLPVSLGAIGVYAGGIAAAMIVLAALFGWMRYRDAGWAYSGGCVALRSRELARTTALAPRRKLQSRGFVSNPLQRRAGLSHLRVRVASGSGGAQFGILDLESRDVRDLIARLGPVS